MTIPAASLAAPGRRLLTVISMIVAAQLPAQTTPPASSEAAPAQAQPEAKKDETLKLSPFQVNKSKDRGYAAGNTLSGGRVDTPLELTPSSISVVTKDFMDDFNVTNINQAGAWTIGFDLGTPVGSSNPSSISTYQVMIRGAQPDQNYPTRNGLINFGVADSYNTERYEFQRGPDTSMFGDGGPGGRQSSSSKRATFNQTATNFSTALNSWGGYRGTVDLSQGWNRIGVRVNGLYQNDPYYQNYTDRIKKAVTVNVVGKLSEKTLVMAEYERVTELNQLFSHTIGDGHNLWDGVTVNLDNSPIAGNNTAALTALGVQQFGTTDYFIWDFTTGTFENLKGNQYGTRSIGLTTPYRIPWVGNPNLPATRTPNLPGIPKKFNLHARGNIAERDNYTMTAAIEHRVGNLSLKLSVDENQYDNLTPNSNTSPNDYRIDLNRLMPDGRQNPEYLKPFVDVIQNRLYNQDKVREVLGLATYQFSQQHFWNYKQQLSLSTGYRKTNNVSWTDAWRRIDNPANLDPFAANSANQIRYRIYWDAPRPDIAPIFRNPEKYFPGKWVRIQEAGNLTERTVKYAGLTSQSTFLNDRLAITASLRRDDVGVDTLNRLGGAAGYDPVTYNNVLGTNGVAGAHFIRDETAVSKAIGVVTYPLRNPDDAGGGWLKKAISPIGFVFNAAENSQPPNGSANILMDGTPAPLTHAKTSDIGLRYSMPGGKAYLTVTHYNTDQRDIPNDFGSVTDIRNIWTNLGYTDPLLVGSTSFSYKDLADRKLEGWEVELTANPTRNLTLTANYDHSLTYLTKDSDTRKAYVAAHRTEWEAGAKATAGQVLNGKTVIDPGIISSSLTNIDSSLASATPGTLEDGTLSANFRHRINFAAAYGFNEGALKGLRFNYGINFKGKVKTGSRDPRLKFGLPDSVTPTPDQVRAGAFDYLFAPKTYVMTAGVSYTHRYGNKFLVRYQLNIDNLTNNDNPIWGRNGATGGYTTLAQNLLYPGSPRMQIMNNFTQYDPRKFTLTTTVSF